MRKKILYDQKNRRTWIKQNSVALRYWAVMEWKMGRSFDFAIARIKLREQEGNGYIWLRLATWALI